MNTPFKLLLVEDDPNLQMVLKDYLEILKYDVTSVSDGESGLKVFRSSKFDLCILDIMLPKMDGFELATAIRNQNELIPIIFLTAKSQKEDRLKGFKTGCDDYIVKPFNSEELHVRIKAILRRCSLRYKEEMTDLRRYYNIGSFTFNLKEMELHSADGIQPLTRKENALLQLLCENMNQPVERELAQNAIWGSTDYFISRSMDVFISRLRKYLKNDPQVAIVNIHGHGFMLKVETEKNG
ncbi:MAG: response regulator transcription factor [Bacteroidales bacterium]|jgi:DNA-binding response OmpR family regulator|nr:response regulator transcription factor [Bacteroidales bacterium]MCK9448394.1 response regulator transcription factor [Bacteroidales bacterium]MDD3700798.1 response regulator transcription factor [Bacteroidales bacterium]MDY0370407.1 response regulator transcription factor [Bacteroidales bacterium]